tara:strand:+ start:323 stop:1444 length:1122 start_codon:yes stop_codon:yes gene_type:complete
MGIFRQRALNALTDAEKLNEPFRLVPKNYWTLLGSLSILSLSVILWSIFGRIPIRIAGRGVLINQDGIRTIQSETPGRIKNIVGNVGDCFPANTILAEITPLDEKLEENENRERLSEMIELDKLEEAMGQRRVKLLEADIERVKGLVEIGAISIDEISTRRRQLSSLKDNLLSRDSQRSQQITREKARINSIQDKVYNASNIRLLEDSCISDRSKQIGDFVQPGEVILTVTLAQDNPELESLVYFDLKDGKRLKVGQPVKITPSTTKRQRHGAISGNITRINQIPIRKEALLSKLGRNTLVESIHQGVNKPMIEAFTTLNRDPNTISGYDWGGGSGPNIQLTPGTSTIARVIVEQRAPISYVIPLLRDLTGIY